MRLNIEVKNDKSQFGSKICIKGITDHFSLHWKNTTAKRIFWVDKTRGEYNANPWQYVITCLTMLYLLKILISYYEILKLPCVLFVIYIYIIDFSTWWSPKTPFYDQSYIFFIAF